MFVFGFVRRTVTTLILAAFLGLPALAAPDEKLISVQGTVSDVASYPVSAALLTFRNVKDDSLYTTSSDSSGAFSISIPDGEYSLVVDTNSVGTAVVEQQVSVHEETDLRITLNPLSSTSVTVTAGVEGPVPFLSAPVASLTELRDEPVGANFYKLEDRLALLPGVSENTRGDLNVNGMPDDQTRWMVYGFGFSSPAPGIIPNPRMPILGVRDVQIVSTALADATTPPGVGATALIEPQDGCGRHHYDFDNVAPSPVFHSGIGVDSWDPAVSVCGNETPSFSWNESASTQYSRWWVPGLPKGQNTDPQWLGANNAAGRWQMTDRKALDFGFLVNIDRAENAGLGTTTFESATRNSGYQYVFSHATYSWGFRGGIFQLGAAETQATLGATPQGDGFYLSGPSGISGNYFQTLHERTSHPQASTQTFLPTFSLLGTHAIAVGAGISSTNTTISQSFTGTENVNAAGIPLSKTLYASVPQFGIDERENDAFVEDRWSPISSVSIVLGIRFDHGSLTHSSAATERASILYAIPHTLVTLYAGYSQVPYLENANLFTRPQDWTLSGSTTAAGQFAGVPTLTGYEIASHLPYPLVNNYTAGVTATLLWGIQFEAQGTEKHSGDALAFGKTSALQVLGTGLGTIPSEFAGTKSKLALDELTASARFDYRAATVSLRKRWNAAQVFASYTRSSAFSTAAIDVSDFSPFSYGNVEGPLPWNMPNQLKAGGTLPTRKWSYGVYVLWRSGLPYTLLLPTGAQFGPADGYSMPAWFSLNVQLGRKISLYIAGKQRKFEVVGVIENITDHANYLGVHPYLNIQNRFTGSTGPQFTMLVRHG